MQKLIDQPTTAILSFYTTSNNTPYICPAAKSDYLHTCAGQGIEPLQGWISQNWLSALYSEANAAQKSCTRLYPSRKKTEQEQQALKDKENAKKELKEKRNELRGNLALAIQSRSHQELARLQLTD
jgi:predicted HicB family RNase H-like nuclease